MLKILHFLLLLAILNFCDRCSAVEKHPIQKRMVHGEYTDIKDVPYIVQIIGRVRHKKSLICGGSIISSQWIITAAHCVKSEYVVDSIATGHDRPMRGQKHTIEAIIPHERYDASISDNDIALIKVNEPITFSARQQAISIATDSPKPGDLLKVSGFGLIGNKFNLSFMENMTSKSLKTALITVISSEECEAIFRGDSEITPNMFCAGRGGDDSCQGDSGGPAVINGQLSGIITGGNECGSTQWSGVYTRLQPYIDWISNNTGLEL